MSRARERKIIHIDMDAFYASVEQRNNPELRGKPVIVGGAPDSRGVVSTCSYEARRYGIHSAMSSAEAYRRSPHAIFIVNPNFEEYYRVSRQIRDIFGEITPIIEPLSLDEAYLDVTRNIPGISSATHLAERIKRKIFELTGLTASAGVSYNKSLAKIASEWKKPDGLTVIRPEEAEFFLSKLAVSQFWGVGPVTAGKMSKLGIHTGADLRSWPLWKLTKAFGKSGPWFYKLCRGIDERPVETLRERKSLGKERTFAKDISVMSELEELLKSLATDVWRSLIKEGISGKTITIKIKYYDFRQITRSRSLLDSFQNLEDFIDAAITLLRNTEADRIPVRLLGVSMSSINRKAHQPSAKQLSFQFAGNVNI